jgi:hypothetical protein
VLQLLFQLLFNGSADGRHADQARARRALARIVRIGDSWHISCTGITYQGNGVQVVDAAPATKARVPSAERRPVVRGPYSALRAAAVVVNHAFEGGQIDGENAVASWRALVAGRWRLVDQFENGGRHILIAVRNDAEVAPRVGQRTQQVLARRALGYSLKVIADELGLSIATVSRELARGSTALGASTPERLTRLVR